MYLDPFDSLALSTHSRHFEDYARELFENSIQEGDTVLDLGAHIGYYTLIAARKVGSAGRVFAFEPASINIKFLKKNVSANGYDDKVIVVLKAVTDKTSKEKFFLETTDSTMGFRLAETIPLEQKQYSLDEFFADYNRPINFIKMDVEGSELRVLAGMRNIF